MLRSHRRLLEPEATDIRRSEKIFRRTSLSLLSCALRDRLYTPKSTVSLGVIITSIALRRGEWCQRETRGSC